MAVLIQGQFLWQGSELSLEGGFNAHMSASRSYKMKVMPRECDKME